MYVVKFILCCTVILTSAVQAADWENHRIGAWLDDSAKGTSLLIAGSGVIPELVVAEDAHSAVHQAAQFLASDIETIAGQKPVIVKQPSGNPVPRIYFATISSSKELPSATRRESLEGKWEAHQILTTERDIWLIGANPRGTAFAGYTLSERIGIDPLYHWTGYQAERRDALIVKPIDYYSGEPLFKYRGLFHDDEDILAHPLDHNGYPQYAGGAVPDVWYERYFETALRLRMNQVAPFVRTARSPAVIQKASDWGLFYTSHHYDILLSNPFGYSRFNLAEARGIDGAYNWTENRSGIKQYWRAGVEENKHLDAIWPVGLRGTADTAYLFPEGTSQREKNRVFSKAIAEQVAMTKAILGNDRETVFHFTLYGEMLKNFQAGKQGDFDLPEDVILVWNDTGDGIMRALPEQLGKWQHGVYYHLAYYGATTKQTHHTITPERVISEFAKIIASGATQYLLLNVSELREYVMNTRLIADVSWHGLRVNSETDTLARNFVEWWAQEYFSKASSAAAEAYADYFTLINSHAHLMAGAQQLDYALDRLSFRLKGDHHVHYSSEDKARAAALDERLALYREALERIDAAKSDMNEAQARFFFEHVELGLLMDYYPTLAARTINKALGQYPDERALDEVRLALTQLGSLESALSKAERPPFRRWYANTWIRRIDSHTNPHYSYLKVKRYLENYTPRYK